MQSKRLYHMTSLLVFVYLLCVAVLPISVNDHPFTDKACTITDNEALLIPCSDCRNLLVDPLGQLYTVDARSELRKYEASGKLLYSYTNRELGDVHSVNVSNPMKVFLFYRDFARIIVLDNTLAEIRRIDIEQFGLQDISAAAPSNDNQLWVFDKLSGLLLKLDQEGREILKSDPMQLLAPSPFIPDDILQKDTRVFLNDFDEGLLIFDQYGQFLKNPSILPGKHFEVVGEQCYFTKGRDLFLYEIKTDQLKQQQLEVSSDSLLKLVITEQRRYYLDSLGVYSY